MMIEPTESEPLEELDLFIEAMRCDCQGSEETPELVKTAPHSTRVGRMDEVQRGRGSRSALGTTAVGQSLASRSHRLGFRAA